MLAAAPSAAVLGIDALDVLVEVHVANGLPQWTLVGLAATAVTYRSDKSEGPTAGTETADPLECLARVLVHIPDKGPITTRYYGGPSWHAGQGGARRRGRATRHRPRATRRWRGRRARWTLDG
jgi:hypothetical protein